MMKIAMILLLLTFSQASVAQVYSFRPTYACQIIHSGGDKPNTWYDRVTRAGIDTLVVNLYKKTLSFPWTNFTGVKTVSISGIEYDTKNNLYVLKTAPDKDAGKAWRYYELKLDEADKPVYLKQVERYDGKRFARDTFFQVYTQDLRALFFVMPTSYMKQIPTVSADFDVSRKEIHNLNTIPFAEAKNTVEMRNGFIHWTEGSDKKAIVHHFEIDTIRVTEDDGYNYITARCYDEHDRVYFFEYLYTKRKLEPTTDSRRQRYIKIFFEEDDRITRYIMLK